MISEVPARLNADEQKGILPQKYARLIRQFYDSYIQTKAWTARPLEGVLPIFHQFIDLVEEQVQEPYQFEPYHKMVLSPTNYHQFGIDVINGVVDREHCTAQGLEHITDMQEKAEQGENVVILGNHQSECDPQAMNILLNLTHSAFIKKTIFVAGERVLTDPMATPFSMGLNLLCVYSKKYIETPPEKRQEKQAHNTKAMKLLFKLLEEGGKVIWVAPSGGRDRPNDEGNIVPAPFDSRALEMFRFIAKKCPRPVHFYPLAIATYNVLPPPSNVEADSWEPRYTQGGPIHLHCGPSIDFNKINFQSNDRQTQRKEVAKYAWNLVNELYQTLPKEPS